MIVVQDIFEELTQVWSTKVCALKIAPQWCKRMRKHDVATRLQKSKTKDSQEVP